MSRPRTARSLTRLARVLEHLVLSLAEESRRREEQEAAARRIVISAAGRSAKITNADGFKASLF